MKPEVDWNEAPLARWLGSITKKGTVYIYKSAYKAYAQYTGKTATELIDEAIEDRKKDVRERKDILKTRILGFYNWLVKEYPVYSRGRGEHKVIRKGVRSKTATTWVNAVRSFYTTYEIYVKLKGRSRLPKARVKNKRLRVTSEDVKKLVDHARTPRDRAIILTMFQSGLDVSTLCSLIYEDVRRGLEANQHPLKLDVFRGKAGVEYYTFLGRDAVEAIKAYVNDARVRGVVFNDDTPLFVKSVGKGEAMGADLVQKVMREVAMSSGLVDKRNNGRDFNPLSPHALRESFGSIMTNKGVPDTIVDFWLGHSIGEMAEAYKGVQFEDLKRMYLEREPFISITVPSADGELKEKLMQQNVTIAGLATRMTRLEAEKGMMVQRLAEAESKIEEYERALKPWKDMPERAYARLIEFLGSEGDEVFAEMFMKDEAYQQWKAKRREEIRQMVEFELRTMLREKEFESLREEL